MAGMINDEKFGMVKLYLLYPRSVCLLNDEGKGFLYTID